MKRRISELTPFELAKEARDLKKQLQRLVKEIIVGNDYDKQIVAEAIEIVIALNEVRFWKNTWFYSKRKSSVDVPEEFLCPISGELMKDPVIVASGETYDKKFIERWFSEVDWVCPKTKQHLHNTDLTPNSLIRRMIIIWCKRIGIEPPKRDPEEAEEVVMNPPQDKRSRLSELLDKLSSPSLLVQKEAALKIRELVTEIPNLRVLLIQSSKDILQLINPLLSGSDQVDLDLREDLITIVYNISIPMPIRKRLADCPAILPILNESLLHGTLEGRGLAAATLGTLAMLENYDDVIGNSGALKNLIDLLNEWEEEVISEANQALYVLCSNARNREKAIEDGLVFTVLEKIWSRVSVEELLPMLSVHVVGSEKGVEQMMRLGVVPLMFDLIREGNSWPGKVRESCFLIVLLVCARDEAGWPEVAEEEARYGTVSRLAELGNQRVRVNAAAVLRKLKGDPFVMPEEFMEQAKTPFVKMEHH